MITQTELVTPDAGASPRRAAALAPALAFAVVRFALGLGIVADALFRDGPSGIAFPIWIALVAAAQAPDGYLNSYVTVVKGGERWGDLAMGHELYCAGHLIQAGVAHRRATGRENLFGVAVRFADLIVAEFGEGGRQVGYCGHPEVETALVELYRETGERAYLDVAQRLVELRGQGLLGDRPFGRRYFQDLVPVREMREVHGHAVRALYLAAGVADV